MEIPAGSLQTAKWRTLLQGLFDARYQHFQDFSFFWNSSLARSLAIAIAAVTAAQRAIICQSIGEITKIQGFARVRGCVQSGVQEIAIS